jgi:hypothetical protein
MEEPAAGLSPEFAESMRRAEQFADDERLFRAFSEALVVDDAWRPAEENVEACLELHDPQPTALDFRFNRFGAVSPDDYASDHCPVFEVP